MVQLHVALGATGIGIKQDRGFVHSSDWLSSEFSVPEFNAALTRTVNEPTRQTASRPVGLARPEYCPLPHAPLPHAEHRFLRDGVPGLTGEHGDLSAMVSVVCDQIAEEAGDIRAKAFDPTVGLERCLQDFVECGSAGLERFLCLRGCDREAVQLLGNFP